MNTLRRTLFGLLLVSAFPVGTLATADPAKAADIRELIKASGAEANVRASTPALARGITHIFRASRRDLPERAGTIIEAEVTALFIEQLSAPGGMLERLEPVYDEAYTHDEIRQLLAFYATPVGRKLIARQPEINARSTEIGRQWGQSLGPLLQQRIEAALKREGMIR